MKTFRMVLVATSLLSAPMAFGLERELINNALNETLAERATIEKSYEENPEIGRPGQKPRAKSGRIEVVIDGEIGGFNTALKDHGSDEVYREKRVQVKLDSELKDVEKDLASKEKPVREFSN